MRYFCIPNPNAVMHTSTFISFDSALLCLKILEKQHLSANDSEEYILTLIVGGPPEGAAASKKQDQKRLVRSIIDEEAEITYMRYWIQ